MSNAYRLSLPQQKLSGTVLLESSKSIANRALIIRSLCATPFEISNLSTSDDTKALQAMLSSTSDELHSGHAGSSYRFMMARACLGDREVTLNASKQLQRRPIGPLVKALQTLGADITYLGHEGFPPLKIKPNKSLGKKVNEVTLQAGISSQYLTALLMIAPMLPKGLTIHLADDLVSESYVTMTLAMMAYFGVSHEWENQTIRIPHAAYVAKDFSVEGDWSSASYFYSMVALAEKAEITIEGLREDSIQGDAVTKEIYKQLGVETTNTATGIVIRKVALAEKPKEFKYDFISCPDIAQTVMVTLAGLGIKGILTGLQTLRIKETDRILAMHTEFARVKTTLLVKEEGANMVVIVAGKSRWKDRAKFETHEDHRMAMSFAPLACIHPIIIKDPEVVSKSYPNFWSDIASVGIKVEKLKGKKGSA